MLSPVFFTVFIDELLHQLEQLGVVCFWKHYFVGAVCYADDIALLAPSPSTFKLMLKTCTLDLCWFTFTSMQRPSYQAFWSAAKQMIRCKKANYNCMLSIFSGSDYLTKTRSFQSFDLTSLHMVVLCGKPQQLTFFETTYSGKGGCFHTAAISLLVSIYIAFSMRSWTFP